MGVFNIHNTEVADFSVIENGIIVCHSDNVIFTLNNGEKLRLLFIDIEDKQKHEFSLLSFLKRIFGKRKKDIEAGYFAFYPSMQPATIKCYGFSNPYGNSTQRPFSIGSYITGGVKKEWYISFDCKLIGRSRTISYTFYERVNKKS